MLKKITFLFSLFLGLNAHAQIDECGTVEPAGFSEAFDKLLKEKKSFRSSGELIIYPIKAHLIRKDDGSGGLTIAELEEAISVMNNNFIHSNLQFYLCDGVNIIESTSLFNFDKNQETFMAQNYEVPGMINIYFANQVTSNGSGLCGYAYYPGGPDRIVMANSCATNGSTLSHEMGHFFSLPHTHGNSNSSSQGELVDGSNCETAGDKICDTPADPLLSYSNVNTACKYTGIAVDANLDKYVPDVKNLMSYARKECRFHFSPMQHEIMEYTAAFVRKHFACPVPGLVTEAILLNGFCPGQNITVNYHVNEPFGAGNVFTVELSSPTGGFGNPEVLGNVQDNVSGTVTVPLPLDAIGNNYRIRVLSSDPSLVSLTNGKNLVIDTIFPNVTLSAFATVCINAEFELKGGQPAGGYFSGNGVKDGIFDATTAGTGTHVISYNISTACTTLTATQEIIVEECLGVDMFSHDKKGKITLAPNPAKGSVFVNASGFNEGTVEIELLRITGETVYKQNFRAVANEAFQKELPLTECAAGLYFVKVVNDDGAKIVKLLVY